MATFPWAVLIVLATEAILTIFLYWVIFYKNDYKWFSKKNGSDDSKSLTRVLQKNEQEVIKSRIKECFSADELKKESFDYFKTKIFSAINYAISRHDWYEVQRVNIFKISLTIISASLSLTAVAFKLKSGSIQVWENIILLSVAIFSVITMARMIYLYNKDLDSSRPHRKISDIRFWFFKYNLTGRADAATYDNVASERINYFSRIDENLRLSASIREDLEQLFILHILQRYKSDSLYHMRWSASYYVGFIAFQFTLYIIISIFI